MTPTISLVGEYVMRHFAHFLCINSLWLSSCAIQYSDYQINESGGSPARGSRVAICSWNRAECFHSASVRLRYAEHLAFCEVATGQDLVVYVSQGYVLPLTANLMQYTAFVACLPGDLAVGQRVPLKWADFESMVKLPPGEVATRSRQALSRERVPRAGSPAGCITLLSHSHKEMKFRVELSIVLNTAPNPERICERALLFRELTMPCQPTHNKQLIFTYPMGASEGVGVPRLGLHRKSME